METGPALRLRGIRRRFGAVQALDGVDLEVAAGEIHALVGENGAGKSTLAAIAAGALRADEGTVEASGTVGLVHQHFALVERLRAWENVVLGREPRRGAAIDAAAARAEVRELGTRYGLEVDPDARVEALPVAIRQRVEVLRALARSPAILLLDEPTAALAPSEIAAFFATVQTLAAQGTAILVVTHKLAEVIAYAQRVTVLRHGRVVLRSQTARTGAAAIARAMVGGEVPALAQRAPTAPAPLLEASELAAGTLRGASFTVGSGEIVGVAGVEGNGQSPLADAIAGLIPFEGTLTFDGAPLGPRDGPAARLRRGIRTIPQDRGSEALVLSWTVRDNAVLGRQRDVAPRDRDAAARALIAAADLRPPDPRAVAGALSGGNQQKLIVARELAAAPRLLVAYQPTRGVDVGAAAAIASSLIAARNAGAAILLISFDLDEILALADRVVVLAQGRIVATVAREGIDRGRIGALMAGER